jgi:DNA-binding CsgD family transcriptional regulator
MVTPVVVGRPVEFQAIADFLVAACADPAAVVIEGEAGIGKTTVWLAAVDSALDAGFQVFSARPAAAESVLAYAALADMLEEVDPDAWTGIPGPQRAALEGILLRAAPNEVVTDSRTVSAGFVSLIKRLQQTRPVLLAIDDLQWLDSSSQQVIAFAARRLSGRVGMLGTLRTGLGGGRPASWLQMPRLAEVRRIRLGPLSLGGLHAVISGRLGRSLSRAAIVRIYEVSQGNPFYAIELAREMDERMTGTDLQLPGSLAELVRTRIGSLGAEARRVLLAAACVSAPTVDLIARAIRQDAEHVVGLLEEAENKGIVGIAGYRINFTHPLLATGVCSEATTAQRRKMHRRLADVVEEPELQARHLAMAVAWGDPHTLDCLDRAAEIAGTRGAPAAAADLLELALGLGGGTAERRIRLAGYHFAAGNTMHARAILEETIASLGPGELRAQALSLLGPAHIFDDSFLEGVAAMERSLDEARDDLALRVPTLVALLLPLFNTGQLAAAAHRAEGAVADAQRLGNPVLLSQALSLRAFLGFLRGDGLDDVGLQSAVEMEDRCADIATSPGFQMIVRPRSQQAILLGWSGQLERAHEEFAGLRESCIEHGLENELIYVTYYSVQVDIWRGAFTEAALLVEQGVERALQLGGEVSIGAAMTWRAALAAYAGNEQQVRDDVSAARAAMRRCGALMLEGWPIATLGFLEVSLGNHEAAMATLEPLLSKLKRAPEATEIYLAEFVPDAVEALVHLGRLDEAEPLVAALERNGRRLDRAWMLAVGARSRSMIQGARGDVAAAGLSAQEAIRHHARIPMPFETARTQLLLGQLERRQRHREAATTALREALATFERLGTPLWADQARAELARTDVARGGRATELTIAEQRVAELAASGMTNREVASALFISPKTVEANLVRIYRKLAIHSRAELGRVIGQPDP